MSKNQGYTLVELLVVLGVTALLSGLLLIYSREGERVSIIMRTRAQVVSDINWAKNLAITSQAWNGQKTCGYGVYFDVNNNRYIIFADLSSDCGSSTHIRGQADTEDVEIIGVPQKFQKFNLFSSNVGQIFFLPPNPTIYFDDIPAENDPNRQQAEVVFTYLTEVSPAFELYINPIGQIWAY